MEIDKVIKEFQPRLKSFIRKRVSSEEDAEDIVQDVFYQLINTIEGATNPIQHVSGWLYRVAKNIIINKGMKKKEVELPVYRDDDSDEFVLNEFSDILFSDILFSDSSDSSPEMEYLRSLVWTELESALSDLPDEQREIFELTEMQGIPVKEIAEAKGVSVNTILSRKYYAIKHLRKRLEDLYEDIIMM